jgi:hypothetical protein
VGEGWVVDMRLITRSGNEIMLEVDGPQHFAATRQPNGQITRNHKLGNTKIRDLCLSRLGKNVSLTTMWRIL